MGKAGHKQITAKNEVRVTLGRDSILLVFGGLQFLAVRPPSVQSPSRTRFLQSARKQVPGLLVTDVDDEEGGA